MIEYEVELFPTKNWTDLAYHILNLCQPTSNLGIGTRTLAWCISFLDRKPSFELLSHQSLPLNHWFGKILVGFKNLFCSPLFGEDRWTHFDEHIFQLGGFNHQLDLLGWNILSTPISSVFWWWSRSKLSWQKTAAGARFLLVVNRVVSPPWPLLMAEKKCVFLGLFHPLKWSFQPYLPPSLRGLEMDLNEFFERFFDVVLRCTQIFVCIKRMYIKSSLSR